MKVLRSDAQFLQPSIHSCPMDRRQERRQYQETRIVTTKRHVVLQSITFSHSTSLLFLRFISRLLGKPLDFHTGWNALDDATFGKFRRWRGRAHSSLRS